MANNPAWLYRIIAWEKGHSDVPMHIKFTTSMHTLRNWQSAYQEDGLQVELSRASVNDFFVMNDSPAISQQTQVDEIPEH